MYISHLWEWQCLCCCINSVSLSIPLPPSLSVSGIIAKELSSLEQEIQELRASGTTLSSEPEFEMADIVYFCRRGVESIVDDEVTKRFSAQELESWNLLTRSNFNARHISLRLSVLWGLGLFIRYGFLLPLRSEVKSQSASKAGNVFASYRPTKSCCGCQEVYKFDL